MATLLDDFLYYMKGKYNFCKNRAAFTDLVFPYIELHTKNAPDLARSENYNKGRDCDFKNMEKCLAYIIDENGVCEQFDNIQWSVLRKDKIKSFVKECIKSNLLLDLKNGLILMLKETDIHNSNMCQKLIEFIEKKRVSDIDGTNLINEWTDVLYFYFYFAVTDKLHTGVAFSMYPQLQKDIDEYNNKVTLLYGNSGKPGMYQLYALAERENPNIIALYECGEMEYYGKGLTGQVNYEKAYEYYERTKECNVEHPLALWSLAYMKFNYSQEKARVNPAYRVQQFENELINGKKNSWYESIIYNLQLAYNNGCSAAGNLIGKILDCSDEEFPVSRRGVFKNHDSIKYYKESADAGYVYGCNNYAVKCMKLAAEESRTDLRYRYMLEAYNYFDKAAKMGNPWAANKIGLFLINGLQVNGNSIVDKDVARAYSYFKTAITMIYTDNYYWPFINLCKLYWLNKDSEKYYEESIDNIRYLLDKSFKSVEDPAQISELETIKEIISNQEDTK